MPEGFDSAARLMPAAVKSALYQLDEKICRQTEEIRLRVGRAASVLLPDGELSLDIGRAVRSGDLQSVLEAASASSVHSVRGELKRGYITAKGGIRVGVCGTAVTTENVNGIRNVSSVSVRIPRQVISAGADVIPELIQSSASILIISPPGGGKTTFLRELVRTASDGGLRVALADERCEVAAMFECEPQFDVGRCTDVMSAAPKAEAAMMLLRAMNPQVIALDEITAEEDLRAIESISNCGVRIFATGHAASVEELRKRPLYRNIMTLGAFDRAVIISGTGEERKYRVIEL